MRPIRVINISTSRKEYKSHTSVSVFGSQIFREITTSTKFTIHSYITKSKLCMCNWLNFWLHYTNTKSTQIVEKKISIFFIDTYLLSIVEWYHIVFFCTKWFFPKNTVCLTKFLPDRKNLRFKFELGFESSYLKKYFSKFNSSHKFEFDSEITALNYYIMRLLTYVFEILYVKYLDQ